MYALCLSHHGNSRSCFLTLLWSTVPNSSVWDWIVAILTRSRWYMKRGEYKKAFDSLCQLRNSRLQAARDLFYIYCLLHAERVIDTQHHRYAEMFTVPRNRRALQASVSP